MDDQLKKYVLGRMSEHVKSALQEEANKLRAQGKMCEFADCMGSLTVDREYTMALCDKYCTEEIHGQRKILYQRVSCSEGHHYDREVTMSETDEEIVDRWITHPDAMGS